jgi:hypothetical protein
MAEEGLTLSSNDRPWGNLVLRKYLLHNLSMDICEPVVAALEAERQLRVVEAKAVQERRLKIVDVNGVLCDLEAKIIAFSMD